MRLTAYRNVLPFAQGLVRDLRVRWALEEAGLPYEENLIAFDERKSDTHRRKQPFGQVPVLEDGDLTLFESGAIVLYIAEKSEGLLPRDPKGRARAQAWVFAALNSIEPYMANLSAVDLFYPNEEWAKLRRPGALHALKQKLTDLSRCLEGKDYLEDRFTAGDLLMTTVLRIPRHIPLLAEEFPVLDAYRQRCEARPAFQKALAAQMRPFREQAERP